MLIILFPVYQKPQKFPVVRLTICLPYQFFPQNIIGVDNAVDVQVLIFLSLFNGLSFKLHNLSYTCLLVAFNFFNCGLLQTSGEHGIPLKMSISSLFHIFLGVEQGDSRLTTFGIDVLASSEETTLSGKYNPEIALLPLCMDCFFCTSFFVLAIKYNFSHSYN